MKKILITGAAGFIGFHICKRLIENKQIIQGIDNLNSYYDPNLKRERLNILNSLSRKNKSKWLFHEVDLKDKNLIENIFNNFKPEIVINMAAQAGVRHSIENPDAYIVSNIVGFNNILECCREFKVKHFLFASSSSVYGGNKKLPYSENDPVDHPVSLYAATKRSNELIAHSYSHLFNLPSTGLRFFTVYGPWGRPDMAPMIFTDAILNKKQIRIFNNGIMSRDFTYIDDVVDVIILLLKSIPKKSLSNKNYEKIPSSSWAPFRILNIGNSKPIKLLDFVSNLEKELSIKAKMKYMPMQKGDVQNTFADTKNLEKIIKYKPNTPIKKGISKFINWYRAFYNI